ncbi:MAG: GMC family oxidoreductase [Myxococcales bacterium]|nr:GMC family oxidoreductase [Myxococcales bacterium]
MKSDFDFVIIGSGFGGSVSALRLAEKGWRVLVIEKGRRFETKDFAKNNWDLRRWMWQPAAGLRGIFQMSFFEHVTVLSGVGVGGGSLTYANTLPTPSREFFAQPSWGHLADWERELAPHYEMALKMLGAATNPRETRHDRVMLEIAREMGREEHFHPTRVAVHFGEPGKRVPDPYFGGEGPERVGCTFCGACMTGCRVGAKNTLDKNYLWLAERRGAQVRAETEVVHVAPREGGGYVIDTRASIGRGAERITADRVVFAGGVLGTMPLLLKMKADRAGLPKLSDRLGDAVRTNNEALIGIQLPEGSDVDLTEGIAITSILHTDEHSHVEPVRYGKGSGFFRLMGAPHVDAPQRLARLRGVAAGLAKDPITWAKIFGTRDWARNGMVLLYMRTLESTLRLRLGRGLRTGFREGLVSELAPGQPAPSAFMPEATEIAERYAAKLGGVPMTLMTETLLGIPSTAHILGGACMGEDASEGVIDAMHRVHGYDGLYVIDGSAVSANPGVNPSLTITALAERAMSHVPARA